MIWRVIRTEKDVRVYAPSVGAFLGSCLSILYIVAYTLINVFIIFPAEDRPGATVVIGILFLCIGGFISLLPASVLGLITGFVLGQVVWRWQSRLSEVRSLLMGAATALVISGFVQGALWL